MRFLNTRTWLVGLVAALALVATACGGGPGTTDTGAQDTEPAAGETAAEQMTEDVEAASSLPTGQFGPACSEIPSEGPGSSDSMAETPVATAASNNPVLSTLVQAVTEAELVGTLNTAEALTVFAPANSAFEKIPQEQLMALLDNQELLTTVLTYHVAQGEQLDARALAGQGEVDTIPADLGPLTVSAEGGSVTVEANASTASVVCGNVQTANATVHILDTVLLPQEMGGSGDMGTPTEG